MGFFDFLKRGAKEEVDAAVADDRVNVMSLLSPEDIGRFHGIPPQAVVAAYRGPEVPAQLAGNSPFVELLHDVIRRHAPQDLKLQAAARAQGDGYMYVIDANTPAGIMGRVPPEDIIGSFKVEAGAVIPESYRANPSYVVFRRERGLVRLPGVLHDALLDALRALPAGKSPPG